MAFGIPKTDEDPLPESGQGVEIEIDDDGITRYILNKNPADGQLIERVKVTSLSELDAKISTLRERQIVWSMVPLEERVEKIRSAMETAFGDDDVQEELARLISAEMGKVLLESREEVSDAVVYMKGEPLDLMLKATKPESVGNTAIIIRDARGIIGIIAPWNYPVFTIVLHLLPALVAGNAVLAKPSEMTPLSGEFLMTKLLQADPSFPIDFVQGDGNLVGRHMVDHPAIDAIAMTGSSATGKLVMKSSAKQLKHLILECGGKDPMVVFQDADLKHAAKDAVHCSTANVGQVCCSVERIYVDKRVKKEFEELCVKECARVKAGNPLSSSDAENNGDGDKSSAVTMGPMVSKLQVERVKAQVEDAISNGANLLYTGDVIMENTESNGNYYPATILTDLHDNMVISQKETFGPIVSIYEFDGSEKEAIRLANDSPWGLSASVYSTDLHKGARVASSIRAGQVAINAWAMEVAPEGCPWVGHKESGHGYSGGLDGYRYYSVPKSIIMEAISGEGDACLDETKCEESIIDIMNRVVV